MTTYVLRNGHMVDKTTADPMVAVGAAPYVIGDEMAPTRHMADGNHYTSKRKFRDATRAAGCVEVGNDASMSRPRQPVQMSRKDRRDAIRHAIQQLRGG